MKAKKFTGVALAFVLSACSSMASLAATASPRTGHSCCPSDDASKNQTQPAAPAKGDCCLRALAKAPAFLLAPQFQVVFAAMSFDRPLLKIPSIFARRTPEPSPPPAPGSLASRSSRAPPVVPA